MELEEKKLDSDPVVMYIVVRESLKMSPGKMAAQVGHGVQKVIEQVWYSNDEWAWIDNPEEKPREALETFRSWSDNRKVVLYADDKEWEKLKLLPNQKQIVVDAGLTELEPNTETIICFWPMKKSESQQTIIKRLQTVK